MMMSNSMHNNSERILYFDAIRAFAILCVVLLHVTGHLAEIMHYGPASIFSLSGYFELFANNFFRIGIALFLMLSGALLLGRDWDIQGFFSKRIPRITKPFIFWSLIFTIILISSSYFIAKIDFVTHFGIMDMINVFVNTLLCKAPGSAVYWFFWTILALYILMPILNEWINSTGFDKIEYFLIVWMAYIFSVYTLMIPVPKQLSFFICPIGFAVLGYYLRYTDRKLFSSSVFAAILIVVPAIVMMLYSVSVVDSQILFVFHRYSILIMMEAAGVFLLFKSSSSIDRLPVSFKNIIYSIAFCSYGMYLIHSQTIMVVRKILPPSLGFTITYVVLFIVGFLLSWALIYILAKVPVINEWIGVK